jgi:hypothetical protein
VRCTCSVCRRGRSRKRCSGRGEPAHGTTMCEVVVPKSPCREPNEAVETGGEG